jgi:hypothetical protein
MGETTGSAVKEERVPERHTDPPRKPPSEDSAMVKWTIVMALSSWALVIIGMWGMWGQRRDARDLLQAQVSVELDKEFGSTEMRKARRQLAADLINKKDPSDYRVMDFFEKVSSYYDDGRVDHETAYEAFSYYVERYWVATKSTMAGFRKQEGDDTFYTGFDELYDRMVRQDAADRHKKRADAEPNGQQIANFLKDEATLAD